MAEVGGIAVERLRSFIERIERLEEELGWQFIQIYGLTETAPLLTYHVPDFQTDRQDYRRRARAGVAALGVDLQLLGDDGQPVPKDNASVGEICARGNMVFKGYWEQPEQTDAAIYDGYFHTGDLAIWDEVGNIQIVDRFIKSALPRRQLLRKRLEREGY